MSDSANITEEMDDPAAKKMKLNSCLICNKESHITDRNEVYTKLLIDNMTPPSVRDNAISIKKTFDYCVDCVELMDDLCQLKEGLDYIVKTIASKVQLVKFAILKSGASGDGSIDRFRRVVVHDYRPKVRLDKKNLLFEGGQPCKNLEEKLSEIKANAKNVLSTPPHIEISMDSCSVGGSVDSDNSQDSKADSSIKIVAVPKPFPQEGGDAGSIQGDKSANGIEDTIIVVTEPPQFIKSQSQVYFENYRSMYKCKFCSMIIKGENNIGQLTRHINVVHAKNSRFKCAICFAIFFSRNKCRSHIGECHFDVSGPTPKSDQASTEISTATPSVSSGTPQTSSSTRYFENVDKSEVAKTKVTLEINRTISPNDDKSDYQSKPTEKYSDNKIVSEVMINIEPESPYNLIEDVVKFEPWGDDRDESAMESGDDPLQVKETDIPHSSSKTSDSRVIYSRTAKDRQKQQNEIQPSGEVKNKIWEKPKLSYTHLAVLAVKNCKTPEKFLPFSAICKFIKGCFPWFKNEKSDWQRNLRFALATDYFKCKQGHNSAESLYCVIENKLNQNHMKESIKELCTTSMNSMAYPGYTASMINCVMNSACVLETVYFEKDSPFVVATGIFDERDYHVGVGENNLGNKTIRTEISKGNNIRVADPLENKGDKSAKEKSKWNPPTEHKFLAQSLDIEKPDYGRPPFTYTHLSFLAINSSASKSLKISEIHNFIKEAFPFFNTYQANWKNSLYLCLKTNDCFKLIKLDANNSRQPRLPSRFAWTVASAEEKSIVNIKNEIKNIITTQAGIIFESIGNHENVKEILKRAVGNDIDFLFLRKEQSAFLKAQAQQKGASLARQVGNSRKRKAAEPEVEAEDILPDIAEEVLSDITPEEDVSESLEVENVPQQPSITIFQPLPLYNIVLPMTVTPVPLTSIKSEGETSWSKPNICYEYLAILAIKNKGRNITFLSLPDILGFIKEQFPWFRLQEDSDQDIPWIKDIVNALSSDYFTWKTDIEAENGFIKTEEGIHQARHYAVEEKSLLYTQFKESISTLLNENINAMAHPENVDQMVSNVFDPSLFSNLVASSLQIVATESMQNQQQCKQEEEITEVQLDGQENQLPISFWCANYGDAQ